MLLIGIWEGEILEGDPMVLRGQDWGSVVTNKVQKED